MNTENPSVLKQALKALVATVRNLKSVSLISIAFNEHLLSFKTEVIRSNFRKIKPIVHFVYRNYLDDVAISEIHSWQLYRGDLDTW